MAPRLVRICRIAARAPVGSARAQLAFGQDSRFSALRSPSQRGSGG